MVQHDGAAQQGRGKQESAQGGHVHQRKRVQQYVPGSIAARCHGIAPGGQPHIVGAGHALGGAGGARGPAHAQHRIGVLRAAAAAPAAGTDVQLQLAAEGHHPQPRQGRARLFRQAGVAQALHADDGTGPQRRRHHLQFVTAVLHRYGRDDGAQFAGRVVDGRQFHHIGQLHEQRVAGLHTQLLQSDSQGLAGPVQLLPTEGQRCIAGQFGAVGLVFQGQLCGALPGMFRQ